MNLKMDPVTGSRLYNCHICLDSGLVTVYGTKSMREVLQNGRLIRGLELATILCNCPASQQDIHKKRIKRGSLRYAAHYNCPFLQVDDSRAHEWQAIFIQFMKDIVAPVAERAKYAGILFDRNQEPTVSIEGSDWEDSF